MGTRKIMPSHLYPGGKLRDDTKLDTEKEKT